MKIDRLQIKLIIGLMFVMILGILIYLLEPKENNENNTLNKKIYINTNQIDNNINN